MEPVEALGLAASKFRAFLQERSSAALTLIGARETEPQPTLDGGRLPGLRLTHRAFLDESALGRRFYKALKAAERNWERRKARLCRKNGCRRRDSNPRHADYDSAALTD
jgi:hypothetical protein